MFPTPLCDVINPTTVTSLAFNYDVTNPATMTVLPLLQIVFDLPAVDAKDEKTTKLMEQLLTRYPGYIDEVPGVY